MAGFIRRFSVFPPLEVLAEIEGVAIIDLIPPGIFVGRATGTVCLAGEWPGGPFNTPTLVEGDQTILGTFSGFQLSCLDPLSFSSPDWTNPYSNGNAFVWLKGKRFRRLVLVRADTSLSEGVHLTLGGTPNPTEVDIKIPAGTRVYDASAPDREYALAQSVTFAAGTSVSSAGGTAFDPTDLDKKYTTRTVSDVPVYSTKNTSEGAVGNVDTVNVEDLFRAGIGAGTSLPSVTVSVTTAAIPADSVAANAAALTVLTASQIDTRYENAFNATLPGNPEVDNVEIIASARTSENIRTNLLANAAAASAVGTGRISCIRPEIGTLPADAVGDPDPGVGANRGDRAIYCYPHFEQRISDLAELDPAGDIVPSANILIGADAAMATILSQLPPELNPGQSTQAFASGGILSFIRKLEDGLTTTGQPTAFTIDNYISFKAAGIAALRRDPRIGEWIFQSGVTSVDPEAFPQLAPIARRRYADFAQDSMAAICLRFNKLPRTTSNVDSMVGELTEFLDGQLSPENPPAQRIAAYGVDANSGNTQALQGSGITVVIVEVQMLDSMDTIVLQTTIGPTVTVTVQE